MEQDASVKRAKFIQSSVETREMFKWAAPQEIIRAIKVHNTAFYWSSLWDLNGVKAKQVFSTWSTTVKLVWGCPQYTRTYILQHLLSCGYQSAWVDIVTRFVKFFHSLRRSESREVQVLSRYLARDIRSVTGRNLQYVNYVSGLNPWTAPPGMLRNALLAAEHVAVPHQDAWRLPYLASLLRQRRTASQLAMDTELERIDELISSLVIN